MASTVRVRGPVTCVCALTQTAVACGVESRHYERPDAERAGAVGFDFRGPAVV